MRGERTSTTRRQFLGAAAGVTGAALAIGAVDPTKAAAAGIQQQTAHAVALELGKGQSDLRSADGGDTIGEIVAVRLGNDPVVHKTIGDVRYEAFDLLTFGFAVDLPFAQWIVDVPSFQGTRRDGAILSADVQLNVRRRRDFQHALISEIGFPALDAASKDPGVITITVRPEFASDGNASGKLSVGGTTQKRWLTSNFRFEIDGLDTTRVTKIDPFTITQKIVEFRSGESNDIRIAPAGVDFPNLVITFNALSLSSWQSWFDDFVVNKNASNANKKSGRIVFLDQTLQTELAVLQLHRIGISRLDPDSEPGPPSAVQMAQAEVFVEQMNFTKFGPFVLT